jgi:hypothetical protein
MGFLNFFCCGSKNTVADKAKKAKQQLYNEEIEKIKTDVTYAMKLVKESFGSLDVLKQATAAKTIADARRLNELPIDVNRDLSAILYNPKYTQFEEIQRPRKGCKV